MFLLTWLTGNRPLLPSQKTKRETADSDSGSLIVYNGAMVDVGSMLQKLDKSEKAREEIEQKLIQQDTKMGTVYSHCCVSTISRYYHCNQQMI